MHAKRDVILAPLRAVNTLVHECPWKNRLRARLLHWRNALPRELMVGRGDIAVQVGMWRCRNVERLARCVGSRGRVILVEADPRNVASVERFLQEQALDNVEVVCRAAWNKPGKIDLFVGRDPAHNRVRLDNVRMLGEVNRDAFIERRTVTIDTVDNIMAELGASHADYVEVSVNGAELQVLQGMRNTLPRTKRMFVAGYARTADANLPTNRRTESYLRKRGFRTTITCRTAATQADFDPVAAADWGQQEGHVFAWRE
jgi:FkbM family methyltransferase